MHHGLNDDRIANTMRPSSAAVDASRLKIMSKRFGLVCLVCLAMGYFGAYVILRNRGIREMNELGSIGILYDSVENVEKSHDLQTHHFRKRLFTPLNLLDQQLFGGPAPIKSILFELS